MELSAHSHSQQLRQPLHLVAALEHATQTVKQLPSTDPSQLRTAFASLNTAHRLLGTFLDLFQPQPSPPKNSLDSVDEPMADRLLDDHDDVSEGTSTKFINKVEEGIRDFAIRNKRKKPLTPTFVPETSVYEREFNSFDPKERMRSLDLIFQFHN